MEKTHEVTKPHNECPRYQNCNINNCPLHPLYPDLYIDPEDTHQKCNMEKRVRSIIGTKYPDVLKYQGLTVREYSAKKHYNSLTVFEKHALAERGKEGLKMVNCGTLQK